MAASLNDGVVGAAAYSVTGAVNPLNVSTAIGLFDQTLPITKQVQSTDPRFSHFFGFCAVYASDYLSSDGNKNKFDNRYRIIVPQDNWNRAIPVYETDVAGNPVIDQTTGKPKIKTETNPITGKVTAVTTDHVVSLVSCPSVFQNTRFSWLMGVENASTKYVVGYNPSTGEAITGQQLTASQYKEKSSVLNMQPFEPDALNDWNNLPKPLFKCDYCVKAIGDAVPGTKDTGSGLSGSTDYATWCNAFPQIDSYADYFDIDPWLVRAIMRHETGFGGANYDAERARCTVAVVAKDQATLDKYCKTFDASGTKCKYASYTSPTTGKSIPIFPGDFGCYDYTHAYNVKNLGDPDGVCANVQGVYLPTTAPDCTDINTDPSLCKATVTNDPLPDDLAYCAYGLTAVIEHPYYDWSDTQTGGKSFTPQQVSEVCGSKYNPLNATDAICWGTYKIKLSWVSSEATVDTHITKGDYFGTEAKNDENIRRRYIASLVIEKNRGLFCGKGKPASQCVEYWIGNYNQIKDGNGAGLCNKITYETTVDQDGKKTTTPKIEDVSGKVIDFPSYLANCAPDDQYGTRKYSEKILNMYNSLISGCSRSDCPYGRLSENRKQP
jgi:ribosome modulation factor